MNRRVFLSAIAAAAAAILPVYVALGQTRKPMKIGVIGSGRIGTTLGGLWAKAGHEVMFSDRDPEQAKRAMAAAGPRARVGSVKEAAAFGDAVLIAVPYAALPAVQSEPGAARTGKRGVDSNNPGPGRDGDTAGEAKWDGARV